MMEKLNPFCKAITILAAGLLMTVSFSVQLNLLVFSTCMVLILFFSHANKKRLGQMMIVIGIAAVSLFMTGLLNSSPAASAKAAEKAAKAASHIRLQAFDSRANTSAGSFYNGLMMGSRILAYAGLGILFGLTTRGEDFIMSLMHQGHVSPKFAYGILAAIHLMPNIAKEYREAKLAFRVRGVKVSKLSLKPLFAALVNVVRWSETLAMAMESKGFDGEGKRTYYHVQSVAARDWIAAVVSLGAIAAGMFLLKY